MLTIFFIIIKLTGTLTLSWWWVIFTVVIDAMYRNQISDSQLNNYEQGKSDMKQELIDDGLISESAYDRIVH